MCFLQSSNIIVSIKRTKKVIANTIIAANAANIVSASAAPIITPIIPANYIPNIIAIIPKQFVLLHFFFASQQ